MESTTAWVLHAAPKTDASGHPPRGELVLETVGLGEIGEHDVLVEPRVGAWVGNMSHAVERQPIDVARQRGDDRIILGTCGVVRVLATGSSVTTLRPGQDCLRIPFGAVDQHGYAQRIAGYDAPGSVGLLTRRLIVPADRLVALPEHTRYPVHRWATFTRYFTAWDNWRVAYRCWRAQVDDAWSGQQPLVVGWGGGVVYAELELARRAGFRTAMVASQPRRLAQVAASGAVAIDRRRFPDLDFAAVESNPAALDRYRASEKTFLAEIDRLSGGQGAAIFLDNIGGGAYRATLKSLAREGVLATVGWKAGMKLTTMRAIECISRHIHVNTHAWRLRDSPRIRDVQEETGWLPPVDVDNVVPFEKIPELAERFLTDEPDDYFPLFEVAG